MTEDILQEATLEEAKSTRTYEREDSTLKVIDTPAEIVPVVKQHNIEEIKAEIARIDGAITLWQEKKLPLQAIVDQYDALPPKLTKEEPTEEPTEEPIEEPTPSTK